MTNKFTNHQSILDSCNSAKANIKLCLAKALMKQEHWRLFTCNSHEQQDLKCWKMCRLNHDFDSSASSGSTWLNHCPLQTQHVIQLQCQTRTRPALVHKVGEKLPKSPSPTSQPETTAIRHGFAPPHVTAYEFETNHPRHAAVHNMPLAHECIQVSKPIQNLIIRLSSAEQRKLMTWSRVWALFPSTRSGIQPQGLKVTDVGWNESAKKAQNEFWLFTCSFTAFKFKVDPILTNFIRLTVLCKAI